MKIDRRSILLLAAGAAVSPAVHLLPSTAFAAVEDVEKRIAEFSGGQTPEAGKITLTAPEIAENGAIVPLEITSRIPNTESIYIFADKNPQPLVAEFDFTGATEPFVSTRIKMGETSKVRAIVKAGGKFYATARDVKVTIGGCGG